MSKLNISKQALVHAFISMCYVARKEGILLSESSEDLFDAITTLNDYDVTDMIPNMDVIRELLIQDPEIKEYMNDIK